MKVYIAGPMTGYPEYNYPAFNAAAEAIARAGHQPINPADTGVVEGWGWSDYLRAALRMLTEAEAIYFLPGWTESRGALLEAYVAHQLGMDRFYVADCPTCSFPSRSTVDLVCEDCGWDYGALGEKPKVAVAP